MLPRRAPIVMSTFRAAVATIGALTLVTSLATPALAGPGEPRPTARIQADRSLQVNDTVAISIARVPASARIVINWGDGTRTTVRVPCTRTQARSTPGQCGTRVSHAYRHVGRYGVSVRTVDAKIASARIQVSGTDPGDSTSTPWREVMLERLNGIRASVGAPPLTLCPALERSAQGYARLMATTNHYGHVGPNGSEPWERMSAEGYRWRAAAENIAAGQRGVAAVMTSWRESSGHYANMVNPDYEHVGFGYYREDGSQYRTYWVQNFGRGGGC